MNKNKKQVRINSQENQNNKASLFARYKNGVYEKRWEMFSICLTLVFTLLGFLLTIGNDFFSQYYYNDTKLFPRIPVAFDDIKAVSDTVKPKYYFILDASGSIRNMKDEDMNNDIQRKIDAIYDTQYLPHTGCDFDIKNGKISYRRLLQVHLLYTLYKLFESEKRNLSVIYFSDRPEMKYPQIVSFDERKKVFKEIYEEEFKGKNSNFIRLFRNLQGTILNSSTPADNFKRRECHLIFFSDYKHEVNKENNDYKELQKAIRDFLGALENKNVDVKLHYLEGINGSKNNPLIDLLISESSSSKVEKLDVDKGMISPMISKKPIPFYYTNSLFEDSLISQIVFKDKKTLSFGLEFLPDNMKQEYYLTIGKDDKIHLSSNLQEKYVTPNENVSLVIKGYIPAPYKSPDIVIEDRDEGVKYIVPIVFYKNFPLTGWGILLFIAVLIAFMAFNYLITRKMRNMSKKK